MEAERDSLEAVFLFLKEKYSSVFLKPSRELVENYLLEMDDLIISINESRLLRYAHRRKKEEEILHIIKSMKEEESL